jgi:HD-GYP domain-containing protein (c-di-GMP phosphodiesterase class II)
VPLNVDGTRIGGISIASSEPRQWSKDDVRLVEAVGHHLAIVAERARLFREAHQRLSELEAVNKISTALRSATTLDEMLPRFLTETLNLLNTDTGFLSLYDRESGEIRRTVARGWVTELLSSSKHPTQGIIGYVCATGEIYQSRELKTDPHVTEAVRPRIHANWSGACLPIRAADDIIGAIMIMVPLPRQLVAEEIRLLTTLAEIAGNAIQRMHSHAQTEQHLQRLTALRTIDNAINASLDLRVTLNVLLGQITAQLGVDAASVLLLNPYTQTLEHAANRGFRSPRAEKMSLRLNEGLAGRAAMERRTISSTNLPVEGANHARAGLLAADSFITYFGTPLITKGTIKGVLEIFHRAPLAPNAEWVDFLETLAGQVAIAVDNAELFETLQRANSELGLAYDATIEGWSRALDLHDRETDGHTQRVTEMTVRLARTFAVSENHLIHIRRGALLHDIGKVAIPDNILLKPGPLTDEEWQVMRRHPEYARDLLASIAYLRPAIDIPYCHHEKWDGKGYPRGLKGEEIPLAARIFAVVDVWDALSSNRPYRNAWTAENTREYLRAQSNTHFDPHILNTFLEMLADGTQSASSA